MSYAYAPLPERSDVTVDIFRSEIIPAGKPVILKGIVKDWNAVDAATAGNSDISNYLVDQATAQPVSIFRGNSDIEGRYFYDESLKGFNFDRAELPFKSFFNELLTLENQASSSGLYMGAQFIAQVFPNLASSFALPLVPSGTQPRIWIGNQSVVSTHFDTDRNIACVVAGKRQFTLFPPQQIANLYPGPIEHNMAGPQVSLPNPEAPDLEKYPKFELAQPHGMTAELNPGDGIYIPPLWWHSRSGEKSAKYFSEFLVARYSAIWS